jgi:hypothetical protein
MLTKASCPFDPREAAMPSDQHASDEAQFIVVPKRTAQQDARSSAALARLPHLAPARNITVVRVIGPEESPRRLVIHGPKAQVAKLQEEFADELVFEEDRPLRLA